MEEAVVGQAFLTEILLPISQQEGLNSNNVQSIATDKKGSIWIERRVSEKDNEDANKRFGQRGLNKYDGDEFVHFSEIGGLNKSDVFTIYKGNSNDYG